MKNKRNRRRNFTMNLLENEKVTIFTMRENVAIEIKQFFENGKTYLVFDLPTTTRISRNKIF